MKEDAEFKHARRITVGVAVFVLLVLIGLPPALHTWNWYIPGGYLSSRSWDATGTIVLALTLIVVLYYTEQTWKIARLSEQELGLRKSPVVSFQSRMPNEKDGEKLKIGEILTRVSNSSNVHAMARIEATIRLSGKFEWYPLSEWHPDGDLYFYSGKRTWSLQAGCSFLGNLELGTMLASRARDEEEVCRFLAGAWVCVRSYVQGCTAGFEWDKGKPLENPVAYFKWSEKRWIPEPGPPKDEANDAVESAHGL
ncbi:MAG: hypothetical protein AB1752_04310 [Candidatus Zixiibacteriota bacterium]